MRTDPARPAWVLSTWAGSIGGCYDLKFVGHLLGAARIDTVRTVVDSFLFVAPDSAVVFSSQLFVRRMKLPEQRER